MIILVVGDVEPQSVFKMVENGIRHKENPGKIESIFPDEPKHHNKRVVEKKLAVAMPQFQMGIKDNSNVFGYDLLKRKVAIEIILSMLMGRSSKLYNELYDEGLINQTFGSEVMLEGLYGFSAWGGQSNEPIKVYERINEMLEKTKKDGLDKESFARIKNAHEGRFIRSLNSPENISHSFIPLHFKGADYFDHAKVYEELTFSDTEEIFYSHFELEPALSVIWPVK